MTGHDLLEKHIREIRARFNDMEYVLRHSRKGGDVAVLNRCVIHCPHKQCLKETLLEVIGVLEDTRKAFKSKQLEGLRKKLVRILADNM